jgi:hypothetical protein
MTLSGDGQGQAARFDPGHLAGSWRVRLAAELLAGHHLPAPKLGRPRWVGGAYDRPGASGRTAPEHPQGIGVADPDGRLAAHIDQRGDRNAERVADPGQGSQVRVGAPLLQRDEHALAHPGARGELVE